MENITIYLKSGASIDFSAEWFAVEKNVHGGLFGVGWGSAPEGNRKLKYIRCDDISAITSVEVE